MTNIQFACKNIPFMQVLKCSFGLNTTELQVLKHLISFNKEVEISDLINSVNKDRTTIQRAVKNLTTKNLLERRQVNLEQGGYIYVYKAKDKEIIKKKIMKIFNSFQNLVEKEVERW